MKIKFGNHKKYPFEEVRIHSNAKGKFVTYQWIIPLPLFMPVKRLSKVYFVNSLSEQKHYAKKYNLINLLIGWWGLPFGPVFLWKSIFLNNKGGMDVSDDVLLNLNQSDYNNGFVNIIKKHTIFIAPNKTEMKEFKKVFTGLIDKQILIESPRIGIFIDTEKNEEPYHLIEIQQDLNTELETKITDAIYKRFYKQLHFKLVNKGALDSNQSAFDNQSISIL